MGKKLVDIETLVRWCYRDEMPKQPVGGLTGWEQAIYLLGTRVDTSNRDYEAMLPVAAGPPHDDALKIDYVVRSLSPVRVNWTRDRDFLLGPLVNCLSEDELIARGMATSPRARRVNDRSARLEPGGDLVSAEELTPASLVMHHAIMGTRPVWDIGQPRLVRINEVNGQPKLIGKCYAKDRYSLGSHCPLRIEPSAAEIACARWEFFIWHNALCAVANVALSELQAIPLRISARPWISADAACRDSPKRVPFSHAKMDLPIPANDRGEAARNPVL